MQQSAYLNQHAGRLSPSLSHSWWSVLCTTVVGSESLLMVSCSTNCQNSDLPLWQNLFSRCWWTLRSL